MKKNGELGLRTDNRVVLRLFGVFLLLLFFILIRKYARLHRIEKKELICHKAPSPICKKSNFHCSWFTCKIVCITLITTIWFSSLNFLGSGIFISYITNKQLSLSIHMFWSNRLRYFYLWTVSLCITHHIAFFHCKDVVRSIKASRIGFYSVSVLEWFSQCWYELLKINTLLSKILLFKPKISKKIKIYTLNRREKRKQLKPSWYCYMA